MRRHLDAVTLADCVATARGFTTTTA
jgi:hypothetical protein